MPSRYIRAVISLTLAFLVLLPVATYLEPERITCPEEPPSAPFPLEVEVGDNQDARDILDEFEPVFTENRGQLGAGAGRLYAQGRELSVALGDGWMAYLIHQDDAEATSLVRVEFVGSTLCPPVGVGSLGRVSCFLPEGGSDGRFTRAPDYARARYEGLWKGIDLELRFADGRLKYEFHVGPWADPSKIVMRYEGASGLHLDPLSGDLLVSTPGGEFRDMAPAAYQAGDGDVNAVQCEFSLPEDCIMSFALGYFDPSEPLVIDPGIAFCTYLGTAEADGVLAMVIDEESRCVLFGMAWDDAFPVTPGTYSWNLTSKSGLLLIRMDLNLSRIELSAFIGLNSPMVARDLAIDRDGYIYLAAHGVDPAFPATDGAFDTTWNGGPCDGYILKLDPDVTRLVYATFIGGNNYDFPFSIAVDGTGCAIVVGRTCSDDFPTTEDAYDRQLDSQDAGFILKLSPDGSTLDYSTYIDGEGSTTSCEEISLLSSEEAIVSGCTNGDRFPITPDAYDKTLNGQLDCFLMRFNISASRVEYSTFLGGSNYDATQAMTVDGKGNVYLAGVTYSSNFPTTTGAQKDKLSGKMDGFVTKFSSSLTRLVYSTYIGGDDNESLFGIAINPDGKAAVTGWTKSSDFPTTHDASKTELEGYRDATLVVLSSDGGTLEHATYLGGTSDDEGVVIALDPDGSIFVAGDTLSNDFPVTDQAYNTHLNGGYDIFIARFDLERPTVLSTTLPDHVTTGDPFTVCLEASDALCVANVTFEYWTGNDTKHGNLTLAMVGGHGRTTSWAGTMRAPSNRTGMFRYVLHARDSTDNDNDSVRGTIPLLDNDAPILSFPEPPEGGYSMDIEICGTVADNIGIRSVNLTMWFGTDATAPIIIPMAPLDDNLTYVGTVSVPPFYFGQISYIVEAVDTSGNINVTRRFVTNMRDDMVPVLLRDRSDGHATTGDPFRFEVEVLDNIGIGAVQVEYWFGDPSIVEARNATLAPTDVSGRGNGTYALDGFALPDSFIGAFWYSFVIADLRGNMLRTAASSVNVTDNDPPAVMVDAVPCRVTTGDPWVVEVVVDDNIGTSSVTLLCDIPGIGSGTFAMVGSDIDGRRNGLYSVTLKVPNDWAGPFNCSFEALDASGNRLETSPLPLMVLDDEAPTVVAIATVPGDQAVKGLTVQVLADGKDNVLPPHMFMEYWFGEGARANLSMVRDEADPRDRQWHYSISIQTPRRTDGPMWFIVSARDGGGNWVTSEVRSLRLVNLAPSIAPLPEWTVTEEERSTLDLSPYIEDANDLTDALHVEVDHPCLSCEGFVLCAMFESWVAPMDVVIVVSDGEDGTSVAITLNVAPVNDAPIIQGTIPASGTRFALGDGIVFHANVTDEDGDPITLMWLDGGKLIGTGQDLIVDSLSIGEHTITVLASDGNDKASLDINITIMGESGGGTIMSIVVSIVIVAVVIVTITWYVLRRRCGSEREAGGRKVQHGPT